MIHYRASMKKICIVIFSIIGLVLIACGAWYYTNFVKYAPEVYVAETPSSTGTTTEKTTVDTKNNTTQPGSPEFTVAEVATHTTVESCYTIINGKVYDLTMWVNMHPGGKQAILSLCGIDGTARFQAKHGSSTQANGALARFLIGTVK